MLIVGPHDRGRPPNAASLPTGLASSGPRWPDLTTVPSLAVASQFGVTLAIGVGPLVIIGGAAGIWLAVVLLVLNYLGVHVPA